MENIFHYTRGYRIADIIESGEIRKSTVYGGGRFRPNEQAVWLTYSPVWEPTATAVENIRGLQDFAIRAESRIRISIDPALYTLFDWGVYLAKSRLKTSVARTLIQKAKQAGSDIKRWRVSFAPVTRWESVEIERDGAWSPLDVRDLSDFPRLLTTTGDDGYRVRAFVGKRY